jgi:hypothetical protein
MADLHITLARKRLKTIATGRTGTGEIGETTLTLTAANIVLGLSAFPESLRAKVFEELPLETPRLEIGDANVFAIAGSSPLRINCQLLLALTGETAHTFSRLDNLLELLGEEWLRTSNYDTTPPPPLEKVANDVNFPFREIQYRPDRVHFTQLIEVSFPNPFS